MTGILLDQSADGILVQFLNSAMLKKKKKTSEEELLSVIHIGLPENGVKKVRIIKVIR